MDIREPGQETWDNTDKYNLFPIKDTDELFLNLIDSLFDELLGNIKYDKEDNLFNLFIDKKYPKNYDMNKLYPQRPISLDYINIYNKSNYVDLLVGNLIKIIRINTNIKKNKQVK